MPELPAPIDVIAFCCVACGAHHGARPFRCESCGAQDIEEHTLPGRGTLITWTVVRRPPGAFAERGPMTVALVDIDAGPRLTVSLEEAQAQPPLGARIRVTEMRDGVPHCVVE